MIDTLAVATDGWFAPIGGVDTISVATMGYIVSQPIQPPIPTGRGGGGGGGGGGPASDGEWYPEDIAATIAERLAQAMAQATAEDDERRRTLPLDVAAELGLAADDDAPGVREAMRMARFMDDDDDGDDA